MGCPQRGMANAFELVRCGFGKLHARKHRPLNETIYIYIY